MPLPPNRRRTAPVTKPATTLDFTPYRVTHVIHVIGTMNYYKVDFTNIKPDGQTPQYFIQIYESLNTEEYKELTTNHYRDTPDHETAVKCVRLSLEDPRYKRARK